jgi:hypothetical protein
MPQRSQRSKSLESMLSFDVDLTIEYAVLMSVMVSCSAWQGFLYQVIRSKLSFRRLQGRELK